MDIVCDICNKTFTVQKNLQAHIRNVHEVKLSLYTRPRLKCMLCNDILGNFEDLRHHIVIRHGIEIYKEIVKFNTNEDFQSWKLRREKEMCCSYIKRTGRKKLRNNTTKIYYFCNNRLKHSSNLNNSNNIAPQTSTLKETTNLKIENCCPSTIELIEDANGKIEATLFFPHVGHECLVQNMRLSKEDTLQIAGQIADGISFDHILEDIKKSTSSTQSLETIHLINPQNDINMKRQVVVGNCVPHVTHDKKPYYNLIRSKLDTLYGLINAKQMTEAKSTILEKILNSAINLITDDKFVQLRKEPSSQKRQHEASNYSGDLKKMQKKEDTSSSINEHEPCSH